MNGPATSVHKLFMLFDRNHARHRWAKAFTELEQPARHWTHRLIANNWRMDHRLSPDREQAMLSSRWFTSDPDDPDANKWWMQRGDYFFQELCQPAVPAPGGKTSAYVHSCNVPNVIANVIAVHAVPGHEQLIHIGSLNRILWRLLNTGTVGLKIDFEDLAGVPFPERRPGTDAWTEFNAQVNAIAATLQSQGPATVKAIAGLLCDGLGDTQPPWWACFAQESAPLLARKDWNTLCSALGLGHLETDEWLLVWRYEVSVAGPLYRPTVVEANPNYSQKRAILA